MLLSCFPTLLTNYNNLFSLVTVQPNEDVRPGPSSEKPPDLKPALVGSTHGIVNALGPPSSSPMHSMHSRGPQGPSSVQLLVNRNAQLKSLQASSQEVIQIIRFCLFEFVVLYLVIVMS